MTKQMKSIQIVIDPEEYQALREIASQTDCSIPKLLRQIIQDWLARQETIAVSPNRLAANYNLHLIQQAVKRRSGIIDENLLAEARQERDQELGNYIGGTSKLHS